VAKKIELVGFARDDHAPRLAQAAALTLGILRYVGAPNLTDLATALSRRDERTVTRVASLVLDADDEELLADEEFTPILWLLQRGFEGKTGPFRPGVLLALCPECDAWSLVDRTISGEKRPACRLTDSCPGRIRTVPAAKKIAEPEGRTLSLILADREGES
jgi:hypothetical protein